MAWPRAPSPYTACVNRSLAYALPVLALACHDSPTAPPAQADAPKSTASERTDAPAASPPHADEAGPDEQAPPPSFDPKPPGPPANDGADELPRLEGQLERDLLAEFGEPTTKRAFTMAACCTEFEIELHNTYPPHAGHDAVEIHQWDWDYDGYTLTVWLHRVDGEWSVIETSRYSDDVEF